MINILVIVFNEEIQQRQHREITMTCTYPFKDHSHPHSKRIYRKKANELLGTVETQLNAFFYGLSIHFPFGFSLFLGFLFLSSVIESKKMCS